MGTRSNIVIKPYSGPELWLYRHWDGYLSVTGADVLAKIKTMKAQSGNGYPPTPVSLANLFLQELYEKQSYEEKPRHMYELTDEEHGDIEYLYTVTISHGGELAVTYRKSEFTNTGKEWSVNTPLTVEEVNREITEMNTRAEAYMKKQGQPFEPQALMEV